MGNLNKTNTILTNFPLLAKQVALYGAQHFLLPVTYNLSPREARLSETKFRKFKEHKNLLSSEEKSILQEIATLKRRLNATWGI